MTSISPEPIYIGGQLVRLRFWGIPRNPGEPQRIEGTMTLVGGEGELTLDALQGAQGPPGQASPIIRVQWDQLGIVTSEADLPNPATLDASDDGRAWFIDGWYHIYSDADGDYHEVQGSIPGPAGATPEITITAKVVEADGPVYGPITVNESGTSLDKHYEIEIPGVPGPEGPAASIESASDYDDAISTQDGDFLVYSEETEKWGPGSPGLLHQKVWTIPESSFIEYTGSAGRRLIASLNIPAQSYAWYPDVFGKVRIKRGFLSFAQLEVEVRIGDTGLGTGETSPLCGLAPYDPTTALLDAVTIAHISPHFSDAGDPSRSISPDSSVARVPEGQAKTIYVFTHVIGGSGSYEFTNPGAQLRVNVVPAY